ncbi:Spore coat protein SA [Gemmata obscuriglobus]|uniref:Glycosyltransferase family 1 protein n=1 Tax=Gemmata obscuriglobus TaxID=114 RepID=A0A2Z3H7P7_9BACT|nr:glycosyltransferase family 4 protein [Gemmata obscuriglobus]AWM39596.1 glycosyltransferase family 1 protein [Gemmata obscuriglobus]QEG27305.1 Spore coat protein SA [Gemmata obscuriglobus]VTS04125.1 group 1 glycosyl transferase : Glycosyl transferase group 1 OS=Cyanothece sp. (strain PCC 7425 / ATCC 29141) GN=Cyan7425_1107 PE=4 SV=1: Glyco_transf_4: Glycos_transf_1 [Gemmata obscuriglobus UQM 2246]
MRVLFLSPVSTLGGAERVLITAVAGVRRADPSVAVGVLTAGDGPLLAQARALGAEVEAVPVPGALARLGDSQLRSGGKWAGRLALLARTALAAPAGAGYVAALRAAVARFRPDVVHSNGIKTHLLSRFAVPRRVPVVWHLHDFYGLRPLAAKLLRRGSGRVRAGVAISEAVAADTAKALPGVPVRTALNAVDLTRFEPGGRSTDLDALAGVAPAPAGTVRVGLVAAYARWKGHLAFLDAAQQLAREAPSLPVRWYIVGGAIYATAAQFSEAELRAAAAERGLADRVAFVPFQTDTADVYRALDVMVHASTLPEPFGLTVAEAMACGRAVVVSAAGGAAELFTDGDDALGAAPGDVPGIAAAVRRFAESAELRLRLGANARRTAEAKFDSLRYGPQLLQIYREVTGPQ